MNQIMSAGLQDYQNHLDNLFELGKDLTQNFTLHPFIVYTDMNTNGYETIWLDFIVVISILLGIFVIITRNPVLAVLYLIGLFLVISGYLLLTGMSFIGLSYLLVYIGAVSILFIFILMLINVRISELHSDSSNGIFLTIVVGIAFYFSLDSISHSTVLMNNWIGGLNVFHNEFVKNLYDISVSSSDKWDGNYLPISEMSSIGNILYTSHGLWLMITSVILLLAMTGTIIITVTQTIVSFDNSVSNSLVNNTKF